MRLPALFALSATALLAACAGTPDPGKDPTGSWVGALVTDQGTCPTEHPSTLRIRDKEILFTPADGAQVLRGTYKLGNQHYHAELAMTDIDHHNTALVFNGYPVGQAIGGIFGSPSCRAHITMTRN
ncbi:hypothetical protein [Gluconobacter sphaericus]|uniref:Lipoprotein n=1 Tax=Gluconobacter sphaericus NBRC 12467 TaxID=1307951 RepID=A0AA37SHN0_9PROT|nr:hypothetical protein [Gluconobacter sphaericus]MBF0884356.1 hypothetical protein [Gluconobacter sphaericus]GBR52979.1 hypothetical protein AA12467_1178 [Gluconobacter sphaericus NBRC 12467]GEB41632.1 hypothetical protein GSP01_04140 [Gluconobacter sphaericus NBRC 12467]GLQ83744.1 hypothetical protein GCM10007872_06520 [Gluconobacter sphaericus NBRC 12467]